MQADRLLTVDVIVTAFLSDCPSQRGVLHSLCKAHFAVSWTRQAGGLPMGLRLDAAAAAVSHFRDRICDPVPAFVFAGWAHGAGGAVPPCRPLVNVPPIEAVLSQPDARLAATAELLLAAEPAA